MVENKIRLWILFCLNLVSLLDCAIANKIFLNADLISIEVKAKISINVVNQALVILIMIIVQRRREEKMEWKQKSNSNIQKYKHKEEWERQCFKVDDSITGVDKKILKYEKISGLICLIFPILFLIGEDLREIFDVFSIFVLLQLFDDGLKFLGNYDNNQYHQLIQLILIANSGIFWILQTYNNNREFIPPVKEVFSILILLVVYLQKSNYQNQGDSKQKLVKEKKVLIKSIERDIGGVVEEQEIQNQQTNSGKFTKKKNIFINYQNFYFLLNLQKPKPKNLDNRYSRRPILIQKMLQPELLKTIEIDDLFNMRSFLKYFPYGFLAIDKNFNLIFSNSLSQKYLNVKTENDVIESFKSIRVSNYAFQEFTQEFNDSTENADSQNRSKNKTQPIKIQTENKLEIPHSNFSNPVIRDQDNGIPESEFSNSQIINGSYDLNDEQEQKGEMYIEQFRRQSIKQRITENLMNIKQGKSKSRILDFERVLCHQKSLHDVIEEYVDKMKKLEILKSRGATLDQKFGSDLKFSHAAQKIICRLSCSQEGTKYSISIAPLIIGDVENQFLSLIIEDSTTIVRVLELEEIIEFQTKSLNSVSHQLRTPLNGSISILDMSLRNIEISDQFQQNSIEPALASNKLLLSMINCIIDNNQIQCTNFTYQFSLFTFTQVGHEMSEIFNFSAMQKHLGFTIIIPEELQNVKINADFERVKQVLINLLSNSFKFTQKGSVTVQFALDEDSDFNNEDNIIYQCKVQDTGCGMCPELLQNLVNLFQLQNLEGDDQEQENSNMQTQGIGFGLRISSRLILGLSERGQFQIKSELGKGSQITFCIKSHDRQKNSKSLKKKEVAFDRQIFFWNATNSDQLELINSTSLNTKNMDFLKFQEQKQLFLQQKQRREKHVTNVYRNEEDIENNSKYESISEPRVFLPTKELKPLCQRIKEEDNEQVDENSKLQEKPQKSRHSQISTLRDPSFEFNNITQTNEVQLTMTKILIIDDNEFNVLGLQLLLEEQGFLAATAYSGQEAIDLVNQIKHDPFTLIISDVDMPEMDGFQTINNILDIYHHNSWKRPFISFCTAFNDQVTVKCANDVGMDYFLRKPVESQKIINLLMHAKAINPNESFV